MPQMGATGIEKEKKSIRREELVNNLSVKYNLCFHYFEITQQRSIMRLSLMYLGK
jgi:hypothetical protein